MAARPDNLENLMSLADQLVWAISTYGGGGALSASQTVTITSGNTSQAWNHAQNTSDVCATALDAPEAFWWMTIDDANNITIHLASADLQNDHTFRVLVF